MHTSFVQAQPYPHLVIDDVFDEAVLRPLYAEIPHPADPAWIVWGGGRPEDCDPANRKRGMSDLELMPAPIARLLRQLTDAAFVQDLCKITGVEDLVVDPTFSGGGLHCSGRGAALRLHADPIRHPSPSEFDQAINLILYFNPGWTEEFGGALELWSRDCSTRVLSIAPLFNRMVIFRADRTTFHGHPEPNRCPEGQYRASLALYYYIPRPEPVPIESNRPVWR